MQFIYFDCILIVKFVIYIKKKNLKISGANKFEFC